MSSKLFARFGVLAAALAVLGSAHADSIVSTTSTFTGTVITFNEYDELVTAGPLDVGPALGNDVWFTSSPFTIVGANAQDLGDNGLWGARDLGPTPTGDGNFLASQFVTPIGSLNFFFSDPVAQVGAYMNQFQDIGTPAGMITLIAYDQSGSTIETFSFASDTPFDSYNEGMFLGFSRPTADIYGFGVANGSFVLDDLTYSMQPVPEPAALAMLLGGLGLIAARRRRRSA